MIAIKLMGGLGNQMFQYAFAYALAQNRGEEFWLDISHYSHDTLRRYELDVFNILERLLEKERAQKLVYAPESFLRKFFRKLANAPRPYAPTYYKEPHFHFDESVVTRQSKRYFEGYWQSEKYFFRYRNDLLEHFSLRNPVHAETLSYARAIEKSTAVSLHVRRGDYVSDEKTKSFHGVCSLDYYEKAAEKILGLEPSAVFFVFSDDLAWAKKHLRFLPEKAFVELPAEVPAAEEMHLMALCRHNVIANSTFSWWGAWLNQNPKKVVIAPKNWFANETVKTSDIYPEGWIKL